MKQKLVVLTLTVLMSIGVPALADHHGGEQAKEQFHEVAERLALTDEQIEKVEPVLRESAKKRDAILADYGMDPDNRDRSAEKPKMRQMRAMRKEMSAVNKKTMRELEEILSDEQLEEFKRIQEERRGEMRERIKAGS